MQSGHSFPKKSVEQNSPLYVLIESALHSFIQAFIVTIINEINLNEKGFFDSIDKEKLKIHYDAMLRDNASLKKDEIVTNKTDLLINSFLRILFAQTNSNNIKNIYAGIIEVVNKYEKSIKDVIINYFLDFINKYYDVYSNYHELYLEYENAKDNVGNREQKCRTVAFKIKERHHYLEQIDNSERYNFNDVLINLLFWSVEVHFFLANLTKDKVDIEEAKNALWTYNSTFLLFDFDYFCKHRSLGIKIHEIFPYLTKLNLNETYIPNQDKKTYKKLNKVTSSILVILTDQKFNKTPYDNTKSLSENILINFQNLENSLMEENYADNQQKRKDFFLFTESILELLENQSLTIFKNLYINLINKHLNDIKNFLLCDENKDMDSMHKYSLFLIYLDRCNSIPDEFLDIKEALLKDAFNLLVSPLFSANKTFLKKLCNLYKKSFLSAYVVKCHIIYISIALNLKINDELAEFEKHLNNLQNNPNNSSSKYNEYLLTYFIRPVYEQKDPIKLGKAFRGLKNTLSFFACYDDDENFKKLLKIYHNLIHKDTKILKNCIDNYEKIRNKISNHNENAKEIILNYIDDYLWIMDEIPETKTEEYKKLLTIKYSLYQTLTNYPTTSDIYLTISKFDAVNEEQHSLKNMSVLYHCENKFLAEDKIPSLAVLRNRQSMCKTAIENLINSIARTGEVPIPALLSYITIYINYEFYLNDDDIFKTFDKSSCYVKQREEIKNVKNRNNMPLEFYFNYSCHSIFMTTDLNNITGMANKTKKIISDLLTGRTKEVKKLKDTLFIWMDKYSELYSKFHKIEEEYQNSLRINTEEEYKKIAKKINDLLNDFKKIDSEMSRFTDCLKNLALYWKESTNLNLACVTMNDIEKAKEALSNFNKNNNYVLINFDIFCKCNLLGIKLYEIIPALENIKKSFEQNSTQPAVYEYLTNYLLTTINIVTNQKLENTAPSYDENKTLFENFLNNLEKNAFFKNSGKKIDSFLVYEAMLELLQNTSLKESYNDLYNTLVKTHLNNIKNLLDGDKITSEDKSFLYMFYIGRYNSILHNLNENNDDYDRVYSTFCELIKTSDTDKANDIINDAINRFPNEKKFFIIKQSLLKDTFKDVFHVTSVDEEELILPALPEKLELNRNEARSSNGKTYLQAYENFKNKREQLSDCYKKYIKEKESLKELSKKIEILYESITQINIEQAALDVLQSQFKTIDKMTKDIAEQNKEFRITTKNLQNAKEEIGKVKTEYEQVETAFKKLQAEKEIEREKERQREAEAKEKKAAAAKEAEAAKAERARKDAEAKAERARKDAEAKAEKARRDAEAKAERARKDAEVKAEKARKAEEAKAERARKDAEAKQKKEAAAKEREAADKARKEAAAKKAEAKTREEAEAKAKAEAEAKAREEEAAKAREEAETKAREEAEAKAREEAEAEAKAREEAEAKAREEAEAKVREEVEKAEKELKAKEESEKAEKEAAAEPKSREEILLKGAGSKVNDQDLASLYKLHKELAAEGIKLKITGSFATRLFIYFYNPEFAELFSIKDIDIVIPYFEDYNLATILRIIKNNNFNYINKEKSVDTPHFLNVKKEKFEGEEIELDLTVEKSSLNSSAQFIPFHFLHLEIIEEAQKKEGDITIPIGEYHFKLCIKEGFEEVVKNACEFTEFLVRPPEDNFKHYGYILFKYLEKLSNCTPKDLCKSNASVNNLLPIDKIHNKLIDYYINKLRSTDARFCYQEMKRFALSIPKGKENLAHRFIQDFYFALLLNQVEFQKNRAQNLGGLFISPTSKKLYEFSSECANLFIETIVKNSDTVLKNIEKTAQDTGNDSFYLWTDMINTIAFNKLNEYKETQEDKDQLAQYQPQFLLPQNQTYQNLLASQQQRKYQPQPSQKPPLQASPLQLQQKQSLPLQSVSSISYHPQPNNPYYPPTLNRGGPNGNNNFNQISRRNPNAFQYGSNQQSQQMQEVGLQTASSGKHNQKIGETDNKNFSQAQGRSQNRDRKK